jgi:hypothetical protein
VVWETCDLFLVLNKVMSRTTISEKNGIGLHSLAAFEISISQRLIHTVYHKIGDWRQSLEVPLQG